MPNGIPCDRAATRRITDAMPMAAVHALTQRAREPVPLSVLVAYGMQTMAFGPEYILPTPFDPRLIDIIPAAVAMAARDNGVGRI